MKTFPRLFKKTSTGAIQQWDISVTESTQHSSAVDILIIYGQVDGKMQETVDTIYNGKNIGKANETTPMEQAIAEAQAKHEKQLKKGYVFTIESAQNDELDEIIEGGVVPMLAKKFADQASKIKYDALCQPKLDGIRCIAIVKNGVATMWSRTRKPITSCPHIIQELEAAFENQDIVLDGELFNLELKSDFEKIVSLVRKEEPGEGHEIIQYHVYDTVNQDNFEDRYAKLKDIFDSFEFYSLKLVTTEIVKDEDSIMDLFDKYVAQGYEGAMVRNAKSKYVNKRSSDLLKVKEFEDDEFDIIDIQEGRGKLAGHAGAFVCINKNGVEFKAKAKGATEKLREYFENHALWKNKKLTVKYQGLTTYGIPRFPVGVAVRDYE